MFTRELAGVRTRWRSERSTGESKSNRINSLDFKTRRHIICVCERSRYLDNVYVTCCFWGMSNHHHHNYHRRSSLKNKTKLNLASVVGGVWVARAAARRRRRCYETTVSRGRTIAFRIIRCNDDNNVFIILLYDIIILFILSFRKNRVGNGRGPVVSSRPKHWHGFPNRTARVVRTACMHGIHLYNIIIYCAVLAPRTIDPAAAWYILYVI